MNHQKLLEYYNTFGRTEKRQSINFEQYVTIHTKSLRRGKKIQPPKTNHKEVDNIFKLRHDLR